MLLDLGTPLPGGQRSAGTDGGWPILLGHALQIALANPVIVPPLALSPPNFVDTFLKSPSQESPLLRVFLSFCGTNPTVPVLAAG